MTNTPENFIQKLRHLTLTKNEAQTMRENLIAYTNMHEAQSSPKAAAARKLQGPAFLLSPLSNYFMGMPRVFAAVIALLVVLVGGSGVSFASERSLPGQPLYGVKVAMLEPIQGVLKTSPIEKAQWQNELTNRRLTEASTLAAQNKLSTSTQEYLAHSVEEHIALAQEGANELSASGDNNGALNVRSDLEAKLSAHASFLSILTPRLKNEDNATTTVLAITQLLHSVDSERDDVQHSRKQSEVTINAIAARGSLSAEASSTPEQARAVAFVDSQEDARHTEEAAQLHRASALLKFLPAITAPTTIASTTASTTTAVTASSTERHHESER